LSCFEDKPLRSTKFLRSFLKESPSSSSSLQRRRNLSPNLVVNSTLAVHLDGLHSYTLEHIVACSKNNTVRAFTSPPRLHARVSLENNAETRRLYASLHGVVGKKMKNNQCASEVFSSSGCFCFVRRFSRGVFVLCSLHFEKRENDVYLACE
jgi:hypothetical protein